MDQSPWAEWWYYKVVLPDSGNCFCFAYGVVNPWDREQRHDSSRAFLQFGHMNENRVLDERFPVTEFSSSYTETKTRIGENLATERMIQGSLRDESGQDHAWDIRIEPKWRVNAMSWAMRFPTITEIGWYPAQADARFTGKVECGGKTYEFESAPGYQDRNWCRSFPKWWVWIVSNQFEENADTVLAVGGGRATVLNVINNVDIVTIALRHKGKEYFFRPQDGQVIRPRVAFGTWEVEAFSLNYRIEIVAESPEENFAEIKLPTPSGDTFHNYETLSGDVRVRMYERRWKLAASLYEWELVEEMTSPHAGIEYGSREPQKLRRSSVTYEKS